MIKITLDYANVERRTYDYRSYEIGRVVQAIAYKLDNIIIQDDINLNTYYQSILDNYGSVIGCIGITDLLNN